MPKTRSSQRLMERGLGEEGTPGSPPPPARKRQRRSRPSSRGRGPMTHLLHTSLAAVAPLSTPDQGQAARARAMGPVDAAPPSFLSAQGFFGHFPWGPLEPQGLLGPGPSEVPRVSSSVHVNQLVAQYSLPSSADADPWLPRNHFLVALSDGTGRDKSQGGALENSSALGPLPRPVAAAELDAAREREVLRGALMHNIQREAGDQAGLASRAAVPLASSAGSRLMDSMDGTRGTGALSSSSESPAGPAEAGVQQGDTACKGGAREPVGMAATFFEDLAAVAANADIDGREAAGEAVKGSPPAGGGSSGLVRGLGVGLGVGVEEETRRVVEEWLRDSPEVATADAQGEAAGDAGGLVPQEEAAGSEDEHSLPQWLLEELGESAGGQGPAPVSQQRLVRADSHGSSTNGPGFEIDWQQLGSSEQGGAAEVSSLSDAQALACEASGRSPRPPSIEDSSWHSGGQPLEVSTFSSPLAQEVLTDDADSAGLTAIPDVVAYMKRSSSTSWIKELLEGDTFWGDLEQAAAPYASASISQEHDFSNAVNGVWLDDGLVAQ